MHLKSICAAILTDEEKSWLERLNDYETDSFGTLIKKIIEIQEQKQINLLSKDDLSQLDSLRKTRNYWVHQCFSLPNPIIFKKDELKINEYATKIITDLNDAIKWDEEITKKMHNRK